MSDTPRCINGTATNDPNAPICDGPWLDAPMIAMFAIGGFCVILLTWASWVSKLAESQVAQEQAEEQAEGKRRRNEALEAMPLFLFKDAVHHLEKGRFSGSCQEQPQLLQAPDKMSTAIRRRSSVGFDIPGALVTSGGLEKRLSNGDDNTITARNDSCGETEMSGDDNEDDSCSICLDEFNPSDTVRLLPCQHLFHGPCVDSWFERSSMCPLCKRCIVGEDDNPPEEGDAAEAAEEA